MESALVAGPYNRYVLFVRSSGAHQRRWSFLHQRNTHSIFLPCVMAALLWIHVDMPSDGARVRVAGLHGVCQRVVASYSRASRRFEKNRCVLSREMLQSRV